MLKDMLDFHALTENPSPDGDAAPPPVDVPYRLYRKAYPRFPVVKLSGAVNAELTVREALERRESAGGFGRRRLKFMQIDQILSMVRIIDTERFPERRTYASAGALFPVELYLLAFDIDGLRPETVYHLNMRRNVLENLWPIPTSCSRENLVTPDLVGAGGAIVLTSVLSRSAVKYGEKAYPFSYLEAGLILQNLILSCAGAEVAACPVGGFIDETVRTALDLPADEIPLVLLSIGSSVEGAED